MKECLPSAPGEAAFHTSPYLVAATLASDKYFTAKILGEAGVSVINGEYFFLHERHRAHRTAGHDREDALVYFRKLGATAFVNKPLHREATVQIVASVLKGEFVWN